MSEFNETEWLKGRIKKLREFIGILAAAEYGALEDDHEALAGELFTWQDMAADLLETDYADEMGTGSVFEESES